MKMKRFIAALLIFALCLGAPALAETDRDTDALHRVGAFVLAATPEPELGSVGGEWAVIGLLRGEISLPDDYCETYCARIVSRLADCEGVLSRTKYTEYARLVLALTAMGKNPRDIGGYDVLTPLGDFDGVLKQGINGPIWALIALDSGCYAVPVAPAGKKQATRQGFLDEILSRELPGGGWSLSGSGDLDVDITGMALQALCPYRDETAVSAAIRRALAALPGMQQADGGFGSAESSAQVLIALCALGLDLTEQAPVKNGNSVLDGLLSLQTDGGGFAHIAGGETDAMASEQALCALAAVALTQNGSGWLYQMSGGVGCSGKDAAVHRVAPGAQIVRFPDLSGAQAAAVEALARRGIIDGMGDGSFSPDSPMTRAQFCAITVRALGLDRVETAGCFSDVAEGAWYAAFVNTAARMALVNGVGDNRFAPDGTITRQEACVMVARAAALCGLVVSADESGARRALSGFADANQVADWALTGVGACVELGILTPDAALAPNEAISRVQVASMLWNMLDKAGLM